MPILLTWQTAWSCPNNQGNHDNLQVGDVVLFAGEGRFFARIGNGWLSLP